MTKSKKIVLTVVAGVGGLLVLLLVCGIVGAAMGVGQEPAKSKGTPEAVATHVASPTARVGAPAHTVAPKPSPTPASVRDRLIAWYANGGQTRIDNLSRDMDQLSTSATAGDFAGTYKAASQMRDDVAAAQRYAPIPDGQAQTLWSRALDDFAASARDITDGIDSMDMDEIGKATDEMNAGTAQLNKLTARINTLGG